MGRKDLHDYLRLTVMIGVLFVVGAAPFAFGAVHPFFYSSAQILVFGLIVVGSAATLLRGQPRPHPRLLGLCVAGLAFGVLAAIQIYPQPAGLVELISPGTLDLVRNSTLWSSPGRWIPLTLRPYSTQLALMQFLACFGIFLLVVTFFWSDGARRKLAWTLCGIGVFLAVVGLYGHWSPSEKIYGFWESEHGGAHFGPFVNRNHFAGFMAMIIPVAASLMFVKGFSRPKQKKRKRREIVYGSQVLATCALIVMMAALVCSLSRGGFIAASVSACVMSALAWKKTESRKAGRICALIFAVGFIFAIFYAGPEFLSRLGDLYRDVTNPLETGRAMVVERTLVLFDRYPVFGTGLGTFQSVFPSVETPELGKGLWEYGHNDWVQLLAEMGITGILVSVTFAGLLGWLIYDRLNQKRTTSAWWLTVGAAASLCGLLVHGLVEFNLHIPSNAYLASAVVGLACVSALSARRRGRRAPYVRMNPLASRIALGCIGIVMLSCSVIAICHVAGRQKLQPDAADMEDASRLLEAQALTPLDPEPAFKLGRLLEQQGREAKEQPEATRLYGAARACYRRAAVLDPADPHYQESLGWLRAWAGGRPREEDLQKAERYLRRAVELDPAFPNWCLSLAEFYLQTGRFSKATDYFKRALSLDTGLTDRVMTRLTEYGAEVDVLREVLPDDWRPQAALINRLLQEDRNEEARRLCEKLLENFPEARPTRKASIARKIAQAGALERARELLQKWVDKEGKSVDYLRAQAALARMAGDSERRLQILEELARISPESVRDQAALARYLESQEEYGKALEHYRKAFKAAPGNSSLCNAIVQCLQKQGRSEEALQTARDFLLRKPKSGSAHYRVAEILYSQDRLVQAAEEYEKALKLDPDNATYKKSLQRTLALLEKLRNLKNDGNGAR